MAVISWNIRSFNTNKDDLDVIIANYNPKVIALQETRCNEDSSFDRNGYVSFSKPGPGGTHHGGITTLVHKSTPHNLLKIDTPLQAIATQVTFKQSVTVCNIYIPPNSASCLEDLKHLIPQLPRPLLLTGDLNAHHPLWGGKYTNAIGRDIEKIIEDLGLCLLNDRFTKTFLSHNGTRSAIDLSLCSPHIYADCNWEALQDTHGSDHFPLYISLETVPEASIPRFKTEKACWDTFIRLSTEFIHVEKYKRSTNAAEELTRDILSLMTKCIPLTKGKPPSKPRKPWFDLECKKAIAARKFALKKFEKYPDTSHKIEYKKRKAIARRTIRNAKKKSWIAFLNTIDGKTSIKTAWSSVRKLMGKKSSKGIKNLITASGQANTHQEIADALAQGLYGKSSGESYDHDFLRRKKAAEGHPLNFNTGNTENYNVLLTYEELVKAIGRTRDTSPGPDGIPFCVLRKLPEPALRAVLYVLNQIWTKATFPDKWREAHVICLHKPGKDPSNPLSYRPISLTNTLCKIMERIICNRMIYHLECNNLLDSMQSGFRKARSTTDHHVRLETFIREAFLDRNHVIGVFFDLEAAYDRCWKHGVLMDLQNLGICGRMALFVQNFLKNRFFRVKLGHVLSKPYKQLEGYPQGSLLSILLFIIQMNPLAKVLPKNNANVISMTYVDDLAIVVRSKSQKLAESNLQALITDAHTWASNTGMKFSETKTICVHFCKKRKKHPPPKLYLGNKLLDVKSTVKFLGVIFDEKLTFKQHIAETKINCQKRINLLKVVAAKGRGATKDMLLMLYRALIRPKLDFGAEVYATGPRDAIRSLNTIQTQSLRIALGAGFRSPCTSLQILSEEPPIQWRFRMLSMKFFIRAYANISNPTCSTMDIDKYSLINNRYPSYTAPMHHRLRKDFSDAGIDLKIIWKQINPFITDPGLNNKAPWRCSALHVDTSLKCYNKDQHTPEVIITAFKLILSTKDSSIKIYTDGSKSEHSTSAAYYANGVSRGFRLHKAASIFTAEATAILKAIQYAIQLEGNSEVTICSDSLSVLNCLETGNFTNPVLQQIRGTLNNCENIIFSFIWIPSHIGIKGNEAADKAARIALENDVMENDTLPFKDFMPIVKKFILDKWKSEWPEEVSTAKLRASCFGMPRIVYT